MLVQYMKGKKSDDGLQRTNQGGSNIITVLRRKGRKNKKKSKNKQTRCPTETNDKRERTGCAKKYQIRCLFVCLSVCLPIPWQFTAHRATKTVPSASGTVSPVWRGVGELRTVSTLLEREISWWNKLPNRHIARTCCDTLLGHVPRGA